MSIILDPTTLLAGFRGAKVERATAALPQTTAGALFTITGGRILLTELIGEVTTVIQTQANNTKLTFDPTDAGATQDLCAVLDITADAVGTMYSLTGTPATAMQDGLNFLSPNKTLAKAVILKPGSILLDCAASNTGSVKWTACWVAFDGAARLVAA